MAYERIPIGDQFDGHILKLDDVTLLSAEPQPPAETLESGTFVVRYGIRYLGKPHLSVVPELVALDYGDMLSGEAAWEFLFRRSNLYPRADVIGYRNDGVDEMIVVKQLDLMQPVEVLVFGDEELIVPMASPAAYIGPAEAAPARMLEYLPHYESLSDWRAAHAGNG